MQTIQFTNENGNVKVLARKELRDNVLSKLHAVTSDYANHVKNVNGGFSLPLGVDELSGKTIWAHIELTVNLKDPNIDSYTGKPKAIGYEVPNLFGN